MNKTILLVGFYFFAHTAFANEKIDKLIYPQTKKVTTCKKKSCKSYADLKLEKNIQKKPHLNRNLDTFHYVEIPSFIKKEQKENLLVSINNNSLKKNIFDDKIFNQSTWKIEPVNRTILEKRKGIYHE